MRTTFFLCISVLILFDIKPQRPIYTLEGIQSERREKRNQKFDSTRLDDAAGEEEEPSVCTVLDCTFYAAVSIRLDRHQAFGPEDRTV